MKSFGKTNRCIKGGCVKHRLKILDNYIKDNKNGGNLKC